jgi:Zn-finger domain-containing protein
MAKFTNGRLENIEILSYEIIDATVRIIDIKNMMKEQEERRKRWYNKYIFYTKYWRFTKNRIMLDSIDFLRKILDKLYWLVVKYL